MNNLENEFLLNPDITFLNNGSFGSCPKVVFAEYQRWQRVLEFQPVDFFANELFPNLLKNRDALAKFIHCDSEDLILTTNATYAVNTIIRSLDLKQGDEVLTTNHEYGACINAWKFWAQEKGFKLKYVDLELPFEDETSLVKGFEETITSNTKVMFFSEITSQTAQLLPAKELCKLARKNEIISVVDAAHAVGQLNISLKEKNPDFYFSNIHKWLYAPKGTAFLYTRKNMQTLVKPLITGWGWQQMSDFSSGNSYVDANQYYGTADLSSYLTIIKALEFYKANQVEILKKKCNDLLKETLIQAESITGLSSLYSNFPEDLQLGVFELPAKYKSSELKKILYEKYKIEIPVINWSEKILVRISVQIYNNKEDLKELLKALKKLF